MSRPEDAPCRDEPDLWFSTDWGDITRARSICATCPLKDPCLQAGIDRKEEGIWGGLDQDERKQLRQQLSTATNTGPAAAQTVPAPAEVQLDRGVPVAAKPVLTASGRRAGRRLLYHIARADGHALCRVTVCLDGDSSSPVTDVPVAERCTNLVCLRWWPAVDERRLA